ncbi:MAG: beta-lactamase family protein [Archangium sp.]|nr:beta-lactamase family protein [Archangium sp.]
MCACGTSSTEGDAGVPQDAGPPGDAGSIDDGGTPPDAGNPWGPVEQAVRAASADAGVPDLALYVFDANDRAVYRLELGSFRSSDTIAVASSSKWISTMVIFDVIRRGQLSLDSTTGQVLGWTGPQSAITLRHLLSFTSGLESEAACTLNPLTTLAACVDTISAAPLVADAGTRFDYGSTHLHVAGRMAEVASGKSWDTLFGEVLRTPLQLAPTTTYYALPNQQLGQQNPLLAGGLRVTPDDYAKLLAMEFHKGRGQVGTPALFDEQAKTPFPNAIIGKSPMPARTYDIRYGLGAWVECDTPATGCAVVSSPGAFGFTPWVDREHGYYAMVAMQVSRANNGVVNFSVELEQQVQPRIVEAMR